MTSCGEFIYYRFKKLEQPLQFFFDRDKLVLLQFSFLREIFLLNFLSLLQTKFVHSYHYYLLEIE